MIEENDNLKNLPFDAEGGAGLYGKKPRVMHVSPPRYMTTRSAVFMAFTAIGLNMSYMAGDHSILIPAGISALLVLLWSFTFRFLRAKWSAPVVVLLFSLMVETAGFFLDIKTLASSMSLVVLGLGALQFIPLDDAEKDTSPKAWREVFVPYLFAFVSSLFGYSSGFIFETRYLFISNIMSVTFLILVSIFISKTSGSRYFFTSKSLTEFWDIPVAEFVQVKIFALAKAKFTIAVFLSFIVLFAVNHHFQTEWIHHLYLPLALVVVMPFIYLVPKYDHNKRSAFGTKNFFFEMCIAASVISQFFVHYNDSITIAKIIYAFVLIVGTDIIGSALLAVIRRRQIFVSRSKYIDGTPFMMTMFSLLIMLAECCLYYTV